MCCTLIVANCASVFHEHILTSMKVLEVLYHELEVQCRDKYPNNTIIHLIYSDILLICCFDNPLSNKFTFVINIYAKIEASIKGMFMSVKASLALDQ